MTRKGMTKGLDMMRGLAILGAFLILAGSGALHGYWTNRWSTSTALERAVARLDAVPRILGEWRGEDIEMNAAQLEQAEIAGHVARQYEHHSGEIVNVFLVCGRSGPIAVHSPEICHTQAGFEIIGQAERCSIKPGAGARPAEFFRVKFQKPASVGPGQLRLFYGWNAAGAWEAPKSPRRHFAAHRALYKLYVSREIGSSDRNDEEVCKEFLKELLPSLEQALFPAS